MWSAAPTGRHTLYFGGEANRENDAQQTTLNDYGVFAFTSHTNVTNRSSAAITDFFFGSPNTMAQDVPVYANANYFNYGIFLQDDWRIRSNLTLNLGIRYDIQTTPTDTQRDDHAVRARRTIHRRALAAEGRPAAG